MMITVNLRPGQKRKPSGNVGKQLAAQLKDLASRVKDPLLAGAVALWVVVLGFLGWTWRSTSSQLAHASEQLEQTAGEARRFDNLMKQKQLATRIRDSLQTQIGVIRGVDRDRYTWPHVLDEVSKAVPAYTWLTDITAAATSAGADSQSASTVQFKVTGRTVDYQAFTQFLRQLEASPWIQNVQTVSSQTVVEAARPVTSFIITADFTQADSAYIRTVPLAQSVR
ncbi:MAG TPA: PilN domain-containing protein [Gemmatimonadales bacterium]|nr:PilN domain-containing protein [Gemmatimonadales bacterium]